MITISDDFDEEQDLVSVRAYQQLVADNQRLRAALLRLASAVVVSCEQERCTDLGLLDEAETAAKIVAEDNSHA